MPLELFTTKLEDLEQNYRVFLESNMREALDLVQAYYEGLGDPIPLQDIVEWHSGNVPDADSVFTFISDLPAITIECVELAALPGVETVGEVNSLIVEVYVSDEDMDIANKLAHRYALAVATILWNGVAAGVKNATEMGIAVSPTVPGGNGQLAKGGRVTQRLIVPAMLL